MQLPLLTNGETMSAGTASASASCSQGNFIKGPSYLNVASGSNMKTSETTSFSTSVGTMAKCFSFTGQIRQMASQVDHATDPERTRSDDWQSILQEFPIGRLPSRAIGIAGVFIEDPRDGICRLRPFFWSPGLRN